MTTANGEMDRGPFGEHVGGNDRRIKACQLLKILTRRSQHKFHLSLKAMLTLQEAPLCWVHGARHFHDLYNFQLSTDANQHQRKKQPANRQLVEGGRGDWLQSEGGKSISNELLKQSRVWKKQWRCHCSVWNICWHRNIQKNQRN